jgi:hypothetical protein
MEPCSDRRIFIISVCLNRFDRTSVTINESYESNRAPVNASVSECDNLVAILEFDNVRRRLCDWAFHLLPANIDLAQHGKTFDAMVTAHLRIMYEHFTEKHKRFFVDEHTATIS